MDPYRQFFFPSCYSNRNRCYFFLYNTYVYVYICLSSVCIYVEIINNSLKLISKTSFSCGLLNVNPFLSVSLFCITVAIYYMVFGYVRFSQQKCCYLLRFFAGMKKKVLINACSYVHIYMFKTDNVTYKF